MSKPSAHADDDNDEGGKIVEQIANLGYEAGLRVQEKWWGENGALDGEENEEVCMELINSLFNELNRDKKLAKLEKIDLSNQVGQKMFGFGSVGPWSERATESESKPSGEASRQPQLGREFILGEFSRNPNLRSVLKTPESNEPERNPLVSARSLLADTRQMHLKDAKQRNGTQRSAKKSKAEGPYDQIAKDFVQSRLHDLDAQADAWGNPEDWVKCIKKGAENMSRAFSYEKGKEARKWLNGELERSHPVRQAIEELWSGVGFEDRQIYRESAGNGQALDDHLCFNDDKVKEVEETHEERVLRKTRSRMKKEMEDDTENE